MALLHKEGGPWLVAGFDVEEWWASGGVGGVVGCSKWPEVEVRHDG